MSAVAITRGAAPVSLAERMSRRVSEAAVTFESRWTMRALKRVDNDLCQAVEEQQQLFHDAIIRGEDADIQEHGESMCRGWAAAVRRMEQEQEPDDSYVLGQDVTTGLMVAVGASRAASARVRELHGERVVWMTPGEIASMVAGLQGIAKVKELWPNAEVIDVRVKRFELYPDQPAQEDE